jgi:hypothetical protein
MFYNIYNLYNFHKGGFKNKKFILNYPICNRKIRENEVQIFLTLSKIIKKRNRIRKEKLKKYIINNINDLNQ